MYIEKEKITFIKPKNWNSLPLYEKVKYYSNTLDQKYSIYVDKLEAKKIVTEMTNGEIKVPKVIKELKNINDIKESDINPNHLLKASHGSKWNLDFKTTTNLNDIKKFLIDHNKVFLYFEYEKQYLYLKPRFFIEEKINDFLTGISGKAAVFMIRCIHGKPISIRVKFEINKNIFGKTTFVSLLYDTNWNYIPQKNLAPQFRHLRMNKPINLDIMLKNSEILANRFEFVRLDYYIDKNNDIYFSEFTFTPSAGKIILDPETEMELGKYWT